jgi:hypothetical protein
MEPSGRNQWQSLAIERRRKRLERAKTVAVGCDRLRPGPHSKERVSGSSPEEGSAKAPQNAVFWFTTICTISNML